MEKKLQKKNTLKSAIFLLKNLPNNRGRKFPGGQVHQLKLKTSI